MSEQIIGLGVRNPEGRAAFATNKFSVLINELHQLGAPVALVGYGEADETMLQQMRIDGENPTETPVVVEPAAVAVIRDFTAGGFPKQAVPMLNEPDVRAVTSDKFKLAQILGDDTHETTLLEPGSSLRAHILNLTGEVFVVKPAQGRGAVGVEIISSPNEADKVYDSPMVVQRFVDSTRMPEQLRGVGEFYKSIVAMQGVPKEIRMYGYRNGAGDIEQVPILRVSSHPTILKDNYFAIIEPESVPQDAYDVSERALHEIAAYTGVPHIHGATDLLFDDGVFKVRESNTKEPAMPGIKKGYDGEDPLSISARKDTGLRTRHLLAKQLVRIANRAERI